MATEKKNENDFIHRQFIKIMKRISRQLHRTRSRVYQNEIQQIAKKLKKAHFSGFSIYHDLHNCPEIFSEFDKLDALSILSKFIEHFVNFSSNFTEPLDKSLQRRFIQF